MGVAIDEEILLEALDETAVGYGVVEIEMRLEEPTAGDMESVPTTSRLAESSQRAVAAPPLPPSDLAWRHLTETEDNDDVTLP